MNKYTQKTVVVPWDFSPMSKRALKATLDLVDTPEKIEVIHVTPYPVTGEYGLALTTLNNAHLHQQLTESFEKAMEKEGLPAIKFTVMLGDPGTVIAEFAKTKKAGLVVISSHGHTGLSRLLLGSVAERVVRLSPCPVLVLRGEEQDEGGG